MNATYRSSAVSCSLKMHDFLDIKTECVNTFKLRTSAAQHKCMHGIYLTGIASLLRQQALRQLWQALLLCFGNKLCASSRHCFFASATSFAPVASEWWSGGGSCVALHLFSLLECTMIDKMGMVLPIAWCHTTMRMLHCATHHFHGILTMP